MRKARDLQIGDVIKSPLFQRDGKGNWVPEKKGIPRRVVRVRPRTALTQVHTTQKFDTNKREIWELASEHNLTLTN